MYEVCCKQGGGEKWILKPLLPFGPCKSEGLNWISQSKMFEIGRKKGNVLFNDTLNTFYIWLYIVGHSNCERGKLLQTLHELLFPISKGSFICIITQTGEHPPQPLLHQSWSTGWNEKYVSGFTMKDQFLLCWQNRKKVNKQIHSLKLFSCSLFILKCLWITLHIWYIVFVLSRIFYQGYSLFLLL